MNLKHAYVSPLTEMTRVSVEMKILSTSDPVKTTVTSVGQQVESLDFSDSETFNTTWE